MSDSMKRAPSQRTSPSLKHAGPPSPRSQKESKFSHSLPSQVEDLRRLLVEKEGRITSLTSELNTRDRRLESLEDDYEALSFNLLEKEKRIENLEDEKDNLVSRLEDRDRRVASLQKEVDTMCTNLVERNKLIASLEENIRKRSLDHMKRTNDHLEREIDTLSSDLSDRHHHRLEFLENENQSLSQQLDGRKRDQNSLLTRLASRTSSLRSKKTSSLSEALEAEKRARLADQKRISSLQASLHNAQSRIEIITRDFRKEHQAFESQRAQSNRVISDLATRNRKLELSLGQCRTNMITDMRMAAYAGAPHD
ncbi:hypothetical protein BDQ17DRAFT_1372591 [Cyathus striatus]|nr:hypothetical protein BDQ17DRAFT_1372591 [Cyathus striatus]